MGLAQQQDSRYHGGNRSLTLLHLWCSSKTRVFHPFANSNKTVSYSKPALWQFFSQDEELPFTRAFSSPTFPTAHLPWCTSQRCLHMPQPFETVRCLLIFRNCPSNFPYLTPPAPRKQHSFQTPQHPKVPSVPSSPRSPPLPEQQHISFYHIPIPMKIFLWR